MSEIPRELLEAAQVGDVEKLSTIHTQPEGIFRRVMTRAAIHGQLRVIQKFVPVDEFKRTPINALHLGYRICGNAARYGHIHILEHIISMIGMKEMVKKYDLRIQSAVANFDQVEVLEWWIKRREDNPRLRYKYDMNQLVHFAVLNGKYRILQCLSECGYSSYAHMIPSKRVSKGDAMNTMIVMHKWKLPGIYQETCESGKCIVCGVEKTWDLWIMDNREFTSSIQWLPREMVEDTIHLLMT